MVILCINKMTSFTNFPNEIAEGSSVVTVTGTENRTICVHFEPNFNPLEESKILPNCDPFSNNTHHH